MRLREWRDESFFPSRHLKAIVRVDVPGAGNSYHFAGPLVLDEETKANFTYKPK
jgi:hypothetical protein